MPGLADYSPIAKRQEATHFKPFSIRRVNAFLRQTLPFIAGKLL
jgi:hypothetical protein